MERKKKQTYCLVCRDYTKNTNPKIVQYVVVKSLDLLKNNKQ